MLSPHYDYEEAIHADRSIDNNNRWLGYVHCDKIFHWSIRNLFGDDFGGLQTAETRQAKKKKKRKIIIMNIKHFEVARIKIDSMR